MLHSCTGANIPLIMPSCLRPFQLVTGPREALEVLNTSVNITCGEGWGSSKASKAVLQSAFLLPPPKDNSHLGCFHFQFWVLTVLYTAHVNPKSSWFAVARGPCHKSFVWGFDGSTPSIGRLHTDTRAFLQLSDGAADDAGRQGFGTTDIKALKLEALSRYYITRGSNVNGIKPARSSFSVNEPVQPYYCTPVIMHYHLVYCGYPSSPVTLELSGPIPQAFAGRAEENQRGMRNTQKSQRHRTTVTRPQGTGCQGKIVASSFACRETRLEITDWCAFQAGQSVLARTEIECG
ncbi:hypothetical protein V8F20_012274 [Naviculisporaceae sp. PSN 640]